MVGIGNLILSGANYSKFDLQIAICNNQFPTYALNIADHLFITIFKFIVSWLNPLHLFLLSRWLEFGFYKLCRPIFDSLSKRNTYASRFKPYRYCSIFLEQYLARNYSDKILRRLATCSYNQKYSKGKICGENKMMFGHLFIWLKGSWATNLTSIELVFGFLVTCGILVYVRIQSKTCSGEYKFYIAKTQSILIVKQIILSIIELSVKMNPKLPKLRKLLAVEKLSWSLIN